MFFFNRKEVYLGYSLEEFSKIKETLNRNDITNTYKVIDRSTEWRGKGTARGIFGSIGVRKKFEKQYFIYVKKKDVENAKRFVHDVLNS